MPVFGRFATAERLLRRIERRIGVAAWSHFWILLFGIGLVSTALTLLWLVLSDWLPLGGEGKTLWDIGEKFGIPVVVVLLAAVVSFVNFKSAQRARIDRELARERAREEALRTYLDRMTELILTNRFQDDSDAQVQRVAEAHTLAVLRVLDGGRKGLIVRFLHETGLIAKDTAKISMGNADLTCADLRYADLADTNLEGADLESARLFSVDLRGSALRRTVLRRADLREANLSDADLQAAILNYSDLRDADLSGANLGDSSLVRANVHEDQLRGVSALIGATLPDDTVLTEERWMQFNIPAN